MYQEIEHPKLGIAVAGPVDDGAAWTPDDMIAIYFAELTNRLRVNDLPPSHARYVGAKLGHYGRLALEARARRIERAEQERRNAIHREETARALETMPKAWRPFVRV
jgi:hypothetical protein